MVCRFATPLLLVLLACSEHGSEQPDPSTAGGSPFATMTEAQLAARIEQARAEARQGDRRVLLEFVADWCEDCREVIRLGGLEPARTVLAERYVIVYVNVGRFDRHRNLIEAHGVDRIATLVVLDPQTGQRVARTTLEPITGEQRGLTSAALAAWLRDPS